MTLQGQKGFTVVELALLADTASFLHRNRHLSPLGYLDVDLHEPLEQVSAIEDCRRPVDVVATGRQIERRADHRHRAQARIG